MSKKAPRTGAPKAKQTASSRRGVVPYITWWDGERDVRMSVVLRGNGRGIRYTNERSFDRDWRGVLWTRVRSRPGRGKPQLGKVHSLRQRQCMTDLRCQVCGGPADRNNAGVLWIIDAHIDDLRPGREDTTHPPTCRPCTHRSFVACPHLRRVSTVVRVRAWEPIAVEGLLYGPVPGGGLRAIEAGRFNFDDPFLPYVRAHQLVVRLKSFTPINLNNPAA